MVCSFCWIVVGKTNIKIKLTHPPSQNYAKYYLTELELEMPSTTDIQTIKHLKPTDLYPQTHERIYKSNTSTSKASGHMVVLKEPDALCYICLRPTAKNVFLLSYNGEE